MTAIAIIGAGGMARDALHTLDALSLGARVVGFFETPEIWQQRTLSGLPVRPTTLLDFDEMDILVAIGNGRVRQAIVSGLPAGARYPRYIHPSVVPGRNVEIGPGSLVCAGSILTCDIRLGAHVQLNIATSITHDCVLDDYVTTAPGVRISGNCRVGARAFLGTNASVRDGSVIGPDAVVGMGAVLISNADEGVWAGNPARRLR